MPFWPDLGSLFTPSPTLRSSTKDSSSGAAAKEHEANEDGLLTQEKQHGSEMMDQTDEDEVGKHDCDDDAANNDSREKDSSWTSPTTHTTNDNDINATEDCHPDQQQHEEEENIDKKGTECDKCDDDVSSENRELSEEERATSEETEQFESSKDHNQDDQSDEAVDDDPTALITQQQPMILPREAAEESTDPTGTDEQGSHENPENEHISEEDPARAPAAGDSCGPSIERKDDEQNGVDDEEEDAVLFTQQQRESELMNTDDARGDDNNEIPEKKDQDTPSGVATHDNVDGQEDQFEPPQERADQDNNEASAATEQLDGEDEECDQSKDLEADGRNETTGQADDENRRTDEERNTTTTVPQDEDHEVEAELVGTAHGDESRGRKGDSSPPPRCEKPVGTCDRACQTVACTTTSEKSHDRGVDLQDKGLQSRTSAVRQGNATISTSSGDAADGKVHETTTARGGCSSSQPDTEEQRRLLRVKADILEYLCQRLVVVDREEEAAIDTAVLRALEEALAADGDRVFSAFPNLRHRLALAAYAVDILQLSSATATIEAFENHCPVCVFDVTEAEWKGLFLDPLEQFQRELGGSSNASLEDSSGKDDTVSIFRSFVLSNVRLAAFREAVFASDADKLDDAFRRLIDNLRGSDKDQTTSRMLTKCHQEFIRSNRDPDKRASLLEELRSLQCSRHSAVSLANLKSAFVSLFRIWTPSVSGAIALLGAPRVAQRDDGGHDIQNRKRRAVSAAQQERIGGPDSAVELETIVNKSSRTEVPAPAHSRNNNSSASRTCTNTSEEMLELQAASSEETLNPEEAEQQNSAASCAVGVEATKKVGSRPPERETRREPIASEQVAESLPTKQPQRTNNQDLPASGKRRPREANSNNQLDGRVNKSPRKGSHLQQPQTKWARKAGAMQGSSTHRAQRKPRGFQVREQKTGLRLAAPQQASMVRSTSSAPPFSEEEKVAIAKAVQKFGSNWQGIRAHVYNTSSSELQRTAQELKAQYRRWKRSNQL